jgi:hypothetical protein
MIDPQDQQAYLALRAANDRLREEGCAWIWNVLERLVAPPSSPATANLQIGRQPWEFQVEQSMMIGERYGVRHLGQTLVIEVGWPRRPQDGHVPGQGLARGRIGLSQNLMLEPRPLCELLLRATGEPTAKIPRWFELVPGSQPPVPFTEQALIGYLERLGSF